MKTGVLPEALNLERLCKKASGFPDLRRVGPAGKFAHLPSALVPDASAQTTPRKLQNLLDTFFGIYHKKGLWLRPEQFQGGGT
ncbi:MAG: hypothetical protein KGY56_03295 [Desulfobacterales bacterium]|nr:hypothetical protein [Desulfobacterales bacterium]